MSYMFRSDVEKSFLLNQNCCSTTKLKVRVNSRHVTLLLQG